MDTHVDCRSVQMTLPHGFGSDRFNEPREPEKKCRLGRPCWIDRCTIHEWVNQHDDAWVGIKFGIGFTIAIIAIVMGFMLYDAHWEAVNADTLKNIEGYNCDQLAEYVADMKPIYSYAEHRYEWLCVNEQIKEFQG